jgi:hypothetical protein
MTKRHHRDTEGTESTENALRVVPLPPGGRGEPFIQRIFSVGLCGLGVSVVNLD